MTRHPLAWYDAFSPETIAGIPTEAERQEREERLLHSAITPTVPDVPTTNGGDILRKRS